MKNVMRKQDGGLLLSNFKFNIYKYYGGRQAALIEADVIIKREGKFYTVPYKRRLDCKKGEELDIGILMEGFMIEANNIRRRWRLVEEPFEGIHGKVLGQVPFDLNEEYERQGEREEIKESEETVEEDR